HAQSLGSRTKISTPSAGKELRGLTVADKHCQPPRDGSSFDGYKLLAEAFVAEFDSPLIFSNQSRGSAPYHWGSSRGNVTDAERGYTWEYFVCCMDQKRIGFVFSLNNE
ncbi:hypothetical protein, partial [Prosthecobacter algae]|uniref:hypothetical protein n=1 Tax=Prosthecobacter algae TaxID=1144682 RepID=UPI0031E55172